MEPLATTAQTLACTFTLVCAPQIGCEPHDGVPFHVSATRDGFAFDRDGRAVAGTALPPLQDSTQAILFEDAPDRLLLTVGASGDAVLTQHGPGLGGRVEAISFQGLCSMAEDRADD